MKFFVETELPVIFLSIIATSQITGFDSLRRTFLQRTENLEELPSSTLSDILEEFCDQNWIVNVSHPRDSGKRIPRFPLTLTATGKTYLGGELLRLEQELTRRGLARGEAAITRVMRLLTTTRMTLRVLGCGAGMTDIQAFRKRLDEAHPS